MAQRPWKLSDILFCFGLTSQSVFSNSNARHLFLVILLHVSLHFTIKLFLFLYRKYKCSLLTIYSTFFSAGGRPLVPPKKNQISSPFHPLPCERKVLFSETSEYQSCWKLSSWHSNQTRLECGYCCGDAKGESLIYDCLIFICGSFFGSSLYYCCLHLPLRIN